jgi:hypothetical protein
MLKLVYVRAQNAGITSGQLLWQLSVACDYSGFPEEALGFVTQLLKEADPLSGAGMGSLRTSPFSLEALASRSPCGAR